jgi:signal transduction histidine kinase
VTTTGPAPELHRLLKRQLDRHCGGPAAVAPELWSFLAAVDAAYRQSDDDRTLMERALELSSQELLQANSEMRAVFQVLPDLFFRLDADGTILDHRGASVEDFYIEPNALHGKKIYEIPVSDVASRFRAGVREVSETGRLVTVEYSLEAPGGRRFYEARLLPLDPDQIIVIIRNTTDRKATEDALAEKAQQLARSNAELEQFAYIASHDLQEPLRTIQSFLQLLERRYHGQLGNDADEFISFAVDGAQRMRSLIEGLLAYARVSSRSAPFEPTALGDVADEVVSMLQSAIAESRALISRGELPVVMADRNQMTQLFQNLIANALKFRRGDSVQVTIAAERLDQEWQVSVADDGIGLDPQYSEKIFVVFQRLHGRDEYPGTGMGLAICRKIVERHGGRLWVESTPGQGARFIFSVPLRREVRHHA